MDIDAPLPLLNGLSPAQFMRRHWQKKPLLVRGAAAPQALARARLFALAARDDVDSRLVVAGAGRQGWSMRHGPFARRALPPLRQPGWTLLVQGVDMHVPEARQMLDQFRFVPDARLDDVMVSYASEGGGVGPHFDSYDVFLFQAQGRRRWSYGPQSDLRLQEGVPLKLLRRFEPRHQAVLEPGDMLYLPPRYAHDGVALGDCMTWSVGFRAPRALPLASELLQRLAQEAGDADEGPLYRDAAQPAARAPAEIPAALTTFARSALDKALASPRALERALGEALTEPKPNTWFAAQAQTADLGRLQLDARTRMLYDAHHVFVNGESYLARGQDARLMRALANTRTLSRSDLARASAPARALIAEWCAAGWMHGF